MIKAGIGFLTGEAAKRTAIAHFCLPERLIYLPLLYQMAYRPITVEDILLHFPELSRDKIKASLQSHSFSFRITSPRQTLLGSFRGSQAGKPPIIMVNSDLKPYTFLLVFLHELAHFHIWNKFKRRVPPHGKEWKSTLRELAAPFIQEGIFPLELTKELATYFKTAPATFHHNIRMIQALAQAEGEKRILLVDDIPSEEKFSLVNGKQYVKIEKRRTRYKCLCLNDNKYYLVSKTAQILLNEK